MYKVRKFVAVVMAYADVGMEFICGFFVDI